VQIKFKAIRISSNKLHSYFTLVFHKCIFTCLQSRINRVLLLFDTDTPNGLTTIGLLSHSSIRPLISKSCIASTTNSLWLTADLLLDKQIEGGVLKNGILYPLYIVSKI
jgi:hypothetical protein